MTDVNLYQTNDDGDVTIENGQVELSAGLGTAAYMSLFGGNEQDDGRPDNALQYWGNVTENQTERQQRSELQYLLRAIPAIPANLRRLEDAAARDLAWFVTSGAASSVSVSATMPALNRVLLVVSIDAVGAPSSFEFYANWKADAGL